MKKSLVNEFQARIVNANRGELLVINYEMLLIEITEAIEAIDEGNEEAFGKAMVTSHKLLRELTAGLDFEYEISKELMSIYIFVNKKFIDASIKKSRDSLEEAKNVLTILLSGWKLSSPEGIDMEAPVIENGQKVYAGLTYGRNNLNESVDVDRTRGFKA